MDVFPPFNEQAEAAVLGCVMEDNSLAPELTLDMFYSQRYLPLAGLLMERIKAGRPIDTDSMMIAVSAKPEMVGALADAISACIAPSLAGPHINDLRDLARARAYLEAVEELRLTLDVDQTSAPCDALYSRLSEIDRSQGGGECDREAVFHELIDFWDRCASGDGKISGLTTTLPKVDAMINGLNPGDLCIIAAQSSVGKSALAAQIGLFNAIKGIAVSLFSLEMSARQFYERMISAVAQIPSQSIRAGMLEPQEQDRLMSAMSTVKGAPIHMCDKRGLTIAQLRMRADKLHRRHGTRLVIVDYLQLVEPSLRTRMSRTDQIGEVSAGLKTLAGDLECPVVALAQLNREPARTGARPGLHNLRDSGNIEQDADQVLFLHRTERGDYVDTVDLLVSKNRNGATGEVPLEFHRDITTFQERTAISTSDLP